MRTVRLAAMVVFASMACAPQVKRVAAPAGADVEFWREPVGREDLFFGVGGRDSAPDPDATYTLLKRG